MSDKTVLSEATIRLAAGLTVEREVHYPTPFGPRYADLRVSADGQVRGLVEVKVGNSPYNLSQKAKDAWISFLYRHKTSVVRYDSFP